MVTPQFDVVGDSDMRRHAAVALTGTPSVSVTLPLPAVRKFLNVQNTTGQAVTVTGPGGGATVPVGAGQGLLVYATGSDVLPIEAALGATGVTPGSYGWDLNVPGETVWGTPRLDSLGVGVGQAPVAFGTGKFPIAAEGSVV